MNARATFSALVLLCTLLGEPMATHAQPLPPLPNGASATGERAPGGGIGALRVRFAFGQG